MSTSRDSPFSFSTEARSVLGAPDALNLALRGKSPRTVQVPAGVNEPARVTTRAGGLSRTARFRAGKAPEPYIETRFFSKLYHFFLQKTTFFSKLNSALFDRSHCSRRPCACGGVTGCLHQQYGTNSRDTFSIGGRAPAHIFGPARKEICMQLLGHGHRD